MNEQRDRVKDEEREEDRWCPYCGGVHRAKVRPAYQFYPSDEDRETGLRLSSLAAQGLWHRMLSYMHAAAPRGWLVSASGKPIEIPELARLVGESPAVVKKLLAELEGHGVFSRADKGVIYCRRMIRDEHRMNARAAGGIKSLENPNVPRPKGYPSDAGKDGVQGYPLPPSSGGSPAVAVASSSSSSSSPSSSPSPATATADGGAPRSSSSSNAAQSSARERGSTETVPPPRSALPPGALLEPERENGNGGSERSAPPAARDASSKKLSMLALAFVDQFYPLGQFSEDRRTDVTKGLKRLLLGRGERYKGKVLHATEVEFKDAVEQVEAKVLDCELDDPNAAWPFVLGCILEMRENGSFTAGVPTAGEASRQAALAEAVTLEWAERLTVHFRKEVGHVERSQVAKALADYVSTEGLSVIESAISLYALDRRADGKSMSFKFFLSEIATWIDGAKDPIVDESGTITAFGHRITRPAIAAGASISLGNQRDERLERARKIGEEHPDWRAEIEESIARAHPGMPYEQRWREYVAPDLIDWEQYPTRRVFHTQKVTR